MKLTRIRLMGRYRLVDGREVNIHKGVQVGRGCDVYFFLYRNSRTLISAQEFSQAKEVA